MRCPAICKRVAGACRIVSCCCIAVVFLTTVLIPVIAFVLPKIRAPTDTPLIRLLPPGKQEMRIPKLLVRGNEELRTVGALLLSLQEPLRLPEMELLAQDFDKTESETAIVTKQTVEIALVECFAAAHMAEEVWIVDPKVYLSLGPVFRGPEGLAKQSLRRLKGTGKIKLERITKMIRDEDSSILEEINATKEGLDRPWVTMQNWKHWLAFCKDQRPRLASLYQRHEGLRQALEGLQRVQRRVEDGAVRDLERYLKRVQAMRDAVVGNAVVQPRQLRMLCTHIERAVNGYD